MVLASAASRWGMVPTGRGMRAWRRCLEASTGSPIWVPARPTATSRALSTAARPLRVLGIESSADDACAAIVASDRQILSNIVCKQHDINVQYGGIFPIKAHERHLEDVPRAIASALSEAKLTLNDLDAIAYTRGPGMFGCLSVGATAARALAAGSGKPLVGVHHMQAHALTPLLTEPEPPAFPFLTLLVSGGHTQLVLAESFDKYSIVMTTLDNSIGDAFDKAARLLQLPMSSSVGLGPVLEEYAAAPPSEPYISTPLRLQKPLSKNKERDMLAFSFSGLLTAAERLIKEQCPHEEAPPASVQHEVSRAFQEAAVGHLVTKVGLAISAMKQSVNGLVVSGGVGSNKYLRERLCEMLATLGPGPIPLFYPPIALCTDNAAMIAWTAILRLQAGLVAEPPNLPIRKRWSLEDLYDDVPACCYS